MKTLSLTQLREFLEEEFVKSQTTEGYRGNFMFLGQEGSGRNSVIYEWISSHPELNLVRNLYPKILYTDKTGQEVLKNPKTGLPYYDYAGTRLDELSRSNTVIFNRRINWGRDFKGYYTLLPFLKENQYINPFGTTYDISSVKFFLATAYPDDGLNRTQLDDEIKDQFEIIQVVPQLKEVVDYMIKEELSFLALLKKEYEELVAKGETLTERQSMKEQIKKETKRLNMLKPMEGLNADFPPLLSPNRIDINLAFSSDYKELVKRLIGDIQDNKDDYFDRIPMDLRDDYIEKTNYFRTILEKSLLNVVP